MKKVNNENDETTAVIAEDAIDAALPAGPIIPQLVLPNSGLYEWTRLTPIPIPLPHPIPIVPIPPIGPIPPGPISPAAEEAEAPSILTLPFRREELRLDVDARYALMVASGTIYTNVGARAHWIANLVKTAPNTYQGSIWYKDGALTSIPYTNVTIKVTRALAPQSAAVTFSGGGAAALTRQFKYKSQYFHKVNFEFDCAQGTEAVTSIQTHAHPNRPATLPNETLTIQRVYQRAGFDVKTTPGGTVPLAGTGPNGRWSDSEMHDAMQTFWSKFQNAPQWAMWVFFASLHEDGPSLGGIMFDDIGPNHRQGTAIFMDTFIANPPAGDPAPAAWVRRMRFWTAVHEMGHAFNLAHSWQKALSLPGGSGPWIPLTNQPEARSFMNYPFRVSGGQTSFFADFPFRFTNEELLFMRHAPQRFVQMGNADWFDNHGFEEANTTPEPPCSLEVRVNRAKPVFEFLEPIVLELKLANISSDPLLLEHKILARTEEMTIIIKKQGKPARRLVPFGQRCWESKLRVVQPGQAMYESVFVSAGQNGWDLAEPGYYTIQVSLDIGREEIISKPIQLRVVPPKGHDEEYWAQDFFTEQVGRVLALDGSRSPIMEDANNTLQEVASRFANKRVAIHALAALGVAESKDYKQLDLRNVDQDDPIAAHAVGGKIKVAASNTKEAGGKLNKALLEQKDTAAETLGHIDYRYYVERFAEYLAKQDARKDALKVQDTLYQTLSARKVLDTVLDEISGKRESYKSSR